MNDKKVPQIPPIFYIILLNFRLYSLFDGNQSTRVIPW